MARRVGMLLEQSVSQREGAKRSEISFLSVGVVGGKSKAAPVSGMTEEGGTSAHKVSHATISDPRTRTSY